MQRYEANSDEVNSVAVHERGTYLAAGDDSSTVQACRLLAQIAQQATCQQGSVLAEPVDVAGMT